MAGGGVQRQRRPISSVNTLFPLTATPISLLLLGDGHNLLLISNPSFGVRSFDFVIDSAGCSVSWKLSDRVSQLAGAVGLAFSAASSCALVIGKDAENGCALFALPLVISAHARSRTKLAGTSWLHADCRITVDNQRQLLVVSDSRAGSLSVYQLSGTDAAGLRLGSSPLVQLQAPGVTNVSFDQHGATLLVALADRLQLIHILPFWEGSWQFVPHSSAHSKAHRYLPSQADGPQFRTARVQPARLTHEMCFACRAVRNCSCGC